MILSEIAMLGTLESWQYPKLSSLARCRSLSYRYRSRDCHPHFHLIVADGVFNGEAGLEFHKACLTQDDITDTQESIQKRVLKYFYKQGFFDKDEMNKMLSYENSGFLLDAKVKIEAWDKDGLERLIRYCARPPFKNENIRIHNSLINYRFPKPSHDGKLFMTIDPLDFLERISHFIPYHAAIGGTTTAF